MLEPTTHVGRCDWEQRQCYAESCTGRCLEGIDRSLFIAHTGATCGFGDQRRCTEVELGP